MSSAYKQVNQVQGLPPTVGVIDPVVRAYLDALSNVMDQRSGALDKNDGNRFITKGEFSNMAQDAIVQAFSPGVTGGTAGSFGKSPSAVEVNQIIDTLSDSIMRSILMQQLEIGMGPQVLDDLRRNVNSAIQSARSGISNEVTIRSNRDLALASAINNIWSQIGGVSAVIDDGAIASASPSAATATKWSAVLASVTDPNTGLVNSTSIKQNLSAYADNVNGKFASIYSVQAQVAVDGRTIVGGFGLSASASTGTLNGPAGQGAAIDFGVRADRFFIAATSATPDAATQIAQGSSIPFMVLTTPGIVNGVTYAPGVYIKKAVIGDATIGTAQISDLHASKITAGFISADRISAGTITADMIVSRSATEFLQSSIGCPNDAWTDMYFYMDHSGYVSIIYSGFWNQSGSGGSYSFSVAINNLNSRVATGSWYSSAAPSPGVMMISSYLNTGWHTCNVKLQITTATGNHVADVAVFKSYR